MQNQDNKLEVLIEHASLSLRKSEEEIRDKYKDFPICLMEYIENTKSERAIEVRFDNQDATLSFSIENNICTGSYAFFDSVNDEELLIDLLVESANYIFRKASWKLPSCSVKVQETKDCTCFYFYQ
ncbi:MAG: hypothetical protein KIC84_07065 [Dysgonomonas mossii]|uniref:hypothetical protein n=1 Tax=Dysgonomonas mossii TaxID=163665 RepID=UPI0026ED183D|nr:hypothetical protein [Dysgonomonas mossii]MBS5906976.1 hypothetical protein [Dysgonomonas mossii]